MALPRLRRPSRRADGIPALSVVVPVYDVAAWLPACLESVAAQTFTDYELVVVDDGSPDDSVAIVERAQRDDARIRLVRQANAGLGAARNAGVREARGELLAFVDSDDLVPPRAWEVMVGSLRRTGSDLVVGLAERDDGSRRWSTPLMRRNHEQERLGIDVRTMPLVLADVFAWNKVFRRSFWDAAGITFPEGVRYEDQPAMTDAFLAARRFDVLTEPVYRWRLREDGTSITQKRHQLEDLVDRVRTKRDSLAAVLALGDEKVTEVFCREVLPVDMWEYFRAVPGSGGGPDSGTDSGTDSGAAYWSTLVGAVRELWGPATVPFEDTAVPPQQRLMGWFVSQDRRGDLEALLAWIDTHRPLPRRPDGRLDHPWLGEAGTPDL